MKKLLVTIAAAICGYVAGALLGYVAITFFSPNVHDRSVEAAMTSAFVTGPLGFAVAAIAALVRLRRRT